MNHKNGNFDHQTLFNPANFHAKHRNLIKDLTEIDEMMHKKQNRAAFSKQSYCKVDRVEKSSDFGVPVYIYFIIIIVLSVIFSFFI